MASSSAGVAGRMAGARLMAAVLSFSHARTEGLARRRHARARLRAHGQEAACAAPAKPMLRAEIYFGRNIGGRLGVGERQWARFVARELTPRFPGGLTVIEGQGQWRGASGSIVHEPSKIVIVFVPDEAARRATASRRRPPPTSSASSRIRSPSSPARYAWRFKNECHSGTRVKRANPESITPALRSMDSGSGAKSAVPE